MPTSGPTLAPNKQRGGRGHHPAPAPTEAREPTALGGRPKLLGVQARGLLAGLTQPGRWAAPTRAEARSPLSRTRPSAATPGQTPGGQVTYLGTAAPSTNLC